VDLQILLSGGLGGTVGAAVIKAVAALWGRYNKVSDDALVAKDQTIAVLESNCVRYKSERDQLGEKYDALAKLRGQEHLRMAVAVMKSQSEPPGRDEDIWQELPTGVRDVADVVASARSAPSKKFVIEEKPRARMPSRRDPREEKD
jgi:hypothetical protein